MRIRLTFLLLLTASAFSQAPEGDVRQLLQSALTLEKSGNTTLAVRQFHSVLLTNPPADIAGQARLELVRIHQTHGDWWEAAAQLQELRKVAPNEAEYAYQLGVVYRNLSKSAFERVQSVSPKSARAQQMFGEQYTAAGDSAKAIAAFHQAVVADPKLPGSHLALAVIYLRMNKREEALAEISRELEIAPESAIAKQVRQVIGGASQ